jgi:hypothetical protein
MRAREPGNPSDLSLDTVEKAYQEAVREVSV